MAENGLSTFWLHTHDGSENTAVTALRSERTTMGFARPTRPENLAGLDPETAARRHLSHALASPNLPQLTAPPVNGAESEFRLLSTEAQPLTRTTIVKFRQTYQKIPVYGSLLTVELDEQNEMLAIHSALGMPVNVDPVATVAPARAAENLRTLLGRTVEITQSPRLCFYFDTAVSRWRLVYVFEDARIPQEQQKRRGFAADFVFDAHNGSLVSELPRSAHVSATFPDDLNIKRTFEYGIIDGTKVLHDETLNLHTYDFAYDDIDSMSARLPGKYVLLPPTPSAVSAHANAAEVATFLRDTLKRSGIDGRGGRLISSVNCTIASETDEKKQWINAAWIGTQMVYGQILIKGKLRSFAAGLDVVAHEIFHGVTDRTSRLQYVGQSGALNESYSDIFGVIVSNANEQNRAKWNWQMGEELDGKRRPLRDLSNPTRHEQPAHMKDYVNLPLNRWGDYGGVHVNSGIPNFAAYKIMTAKKNGQFVFSIPEIAALFYLALTNYLSRTSQFIDARRATEQVAQTLFRNPPKHAANKAALVSRAFDEVGIV